MKHALSTGGKAFNLRGAALKNPCRQMVLHPLLAQLLLQLQNLFIHQVEQLGITRLNTSASVWRCRLRGGRPPTLGTSTFSSLPTMEPSAQPWRTLIASASLGGVPKA
jgi:hypothetical protein